ncbi:MAG: hypothetical protein IKF07_01440 [Eubacterium sp.]|nr:hypothetical protein [Eubacterium sp.]
MDIRKMREDVIAVMREMEIPYELETADIVKINDSHMYGIVFKQGDVGKTIYINDFMDTGASAADIAEQIITACETATDVPPFDMIDTLKAGQPISEISDNLYVALVGDDRNEEYLKQVISMPAGSGLSFICQVRYNTGEGFMSTTITKDLAKSNNWNIQELFDIALTNTDEKDPAVMYGMNDALFMEAKNNLLSSDEDVSDEMLILSNRSGMFGAVAMFLPDVIDKIHDRLKQAFFAIPSSIHEFIIIPESSGMTMPALNAMCREANATVVRYNEILSDNVLYMPYKK